MSQRAIRKRENQLNSNRQGQPNPNHYKKTTTITTQQQPKQRHGLHVTSGLGGVPTTSTEANRSLYSLQQQHRILGRASRSTPELRSRPSDRFEYFRLLRTKSENDVNVLLNCCTGNATNTSGRGLIGAKSEVCLQTISSHSYSGLAGVSSEISNQTLPFKDNMLTGARSHRDLMQSTYAHAYDVNSPRRMSECSLNSSGAYSHRTGSVLTVSSSATESNAVLRVPIIGYEVMEERARFTVYKLRVENPSTNDCWLVLRRYTDFVRLNAKLKQNFANMTLALPRKKIFGDNFNSVFLDNRVQGLQMFVNSIMSKEELRKCKLVREFFCLDEPPSYSESMEECRAIFEAQEETISHLKLQISSKNDLILGLQQKVREEMVEKEHLQEALKNMSLICSRCTATISNGAAGPAH